MQVLVKHQYKDQVWYEVEEVKPHEMKLIMCGTNGKTMGKTHEQTKQTDERRRVGLSQLNFEERKSQTNSR